MTVYPINSQYAQHDPLVSLLRAEKALLAAGARGDPVGEELTDVRNAIRSMVESRERQNEGGRQR